jgi:hypothetical protein
VKRDDLLKRDPTHLISRQDEDMARGPGLNMSPDAPDRIGRTPIPLLALRRLRSRDDLDEFGRFREAPQSVRLHHVPIERDGIKLRENVDAAQPGMQTLAEREINEPILAEEGESRFGAFGGQGEEASAMPESQDNGEDLMLMPVCAHSPIHAESSF